MLKKTLVACLCIAVLVVGCKREKKRKLEEWQKRRPKWSDKTPEEWLDLIKHPRSDSARQQATDALVQYGKRDGPQTYVPPLVEIVQDRQLGPGRRAAARALGWMGPGADGAVPALCEALLDTGWKDRDVAAWALGRIAGNSDQARAALLKAMKDEDGRIRGAAAQALGKLGGSAGEDSQSVDALIEQLGSSDNFVQAEAADALGRMGPGAKKAVPALKKAQQSEYHNVRQAAEEALKKIEGT